MWFPFTLSCCVDNLHKSNIGIYFSIALFRFVMRDLSESLNFDLLEMQIGDQELSEMKETEISRHLKSSESDDRNENNRLDVDPPMKRF